jgi:hypothetical protein
MAKKSKTLVSPEEHAKMFLERDLKDIKERVAFGITPKNPTRLFAVGERVQWGVHKETYIVEIGEDNLYYKIVSKNVQRDRNNPPADEYYYMEWNDLFKVGTIKPTTFRKEEKYQIRLCNAGIDSLLNMVYHTGVDFDVDYQRDHVWSLEDKVALIDSIFNNIDIGKFVLVRRDFNVETKLLEIIDGKQRLTALKEFYEDRFKYKGFFFSELSNFDKDKFENHGITYGYLENPDKRAIFETFIKLNTCGKPMDVKHIQKVKRLLNELDK